MPHPQHAGRHGAGNLRQDRSQDRNGPGKGHDSTERPRAISAPYNFVPLANWVHTPDWAAQVSHDLPFRDGCSGEIVYTLQADTPLLVGGQQKKPGNNQLGEVKPFQLPDGRYAIPGASLKGMLRAVTEIAGFGRMRAVDDARPALRDISGPYVKTSYTTKVRNRMRTGLLRRREDGRNVIVPCDMSRLDHRMLEQALGLGASHPIFGQEDSVATKYAKWRDVCRQRSWNPDEMRFSNAAKGQAVNLGDGDLVGLPVFTGQTSGKKRDFLFYAPRPDETLDVPDAAWRDFLRIHGDENGTQDMSWPGHWKATHRRGGEVPVFYLPDGALLRIGLAFMPKLAGNFSIHDAIAESSPEHLQQPGNGHGYDLADLLFGAVNGEQQAAALRGRVSCETAIASSVLQTITQPPTILNGPKPTFFPNYLNQNATADGALPHGGQYVTYIGGAAGARPTLRGFKRYPVRPEAKACVQPLTPDQVGSTNVQVRLQTLPSGSTFAGRIVFHNLRPVELGALLWVLTWGGHGDLRHSLGMGKPFGFGQVHCTLDTAASHLVPNDPAQAEAPLDAERVEALLRVFETHMHTVCAAAGQTGNWLTSPQMVNLLAMADPASASRLPAGMELRHMRLDAKQRVNEFQGAKQAGLVLQDYAKATGALDVWRDRTQQREHHARQLAQQQLEAELAALSPAQRATLEWTQAMSARAAQLAPGKKDRPNTELHARTRQLARTALEASDWSADERHALADAIEQWLPRIVDVDMKAERKALKLAALRGTPVT